MYKSKEDNRLVVVKTCRGGKTYELMEKCFDAVNDGMDVLFLCINRPQAHMTYNLFVEKFMRHEGVSLIPQELEVDGIDGGSIKFQSIGEYNTSIQRKRYTFKVIDNLDYLYNDFDIISLTGVVSDG